MSIIVTNLSKSYGKQKALDNLSIEIKSGQITGLLGPNGAGKSTLMKIITGSLLPDEGMVEVNGVNVADQPLKVQKVLGYLPEHNPQYLELYVKEYLAYVASIYKVEKSAVDRVIEQTVLGPEQHKKIGSLSKGYRQRVGLAAALIPDPEVLILDEPTNHLDMEMIEWLEAYFIKEKLTLLMVTHDRYFLERVCNEIIELDEGDLYSYKGSYSYYLEKRAIRIAHEETVAHKTKRHFVKELEWMRRQPKARTTKSKSRIDDFKIIKEKTQQRRNDHEVQLEINMERLGSKMIEMHKVSKAFKDTVILDQFDYNFQRNDRIGIIGKNGTGKSTLLNLLTNSIQPDTGKIIRGETLKFGYYTQGGIKIKEGQKVIEVIQEFGEYIPLKKGKKISAQQLLERFLFDRKKQYDFVEKLSGGERKRLYLCTVLIQNPNFLILDEPTNDLDIITLNVLESFLLDFPGCLLVVSHDRYFMDKIVDHLFVLKGQGQIEDFPGNYSDYRAYEGENQSQNNTTEKKVKKEWKKETNSQKGLSYQDQQTFKKLEKTINKLEEEKELLQNRFVNEALSPEEIKALSITLSELEADLEQKSDQWLEFSMLMEE